MLRFDVAFGGQVMYHKDMNNNETRINAKDLMPGQVFHTSNTDTPYVCEGFPRTGSGRAVVTYHVLGEPTHRAEFICAMLSSMYLMGE